jgi:rhodanese-related sulfurtransferase
MTQKYSHKLKIKFSGLILVMLFLSIALIMPSVSAYKWDNEPVNKNISVKEAEKLIKKLNPVILDVRSSVEFEYSHLFNAINIPLEELEGRILELEDLKDNAILVYCKTGINSQLASNLLFSYGFRKIYNMLGGIQAWIEADNIISTFHHYINVTKPYDVTPLIRGSSCSSCNCDNNIPNIEEIILLENETHLVLLHTYEIDGISYETQTTIITITKWTYTEQSNDRNLTVSFSSIDIIGEDYSLQYDTLIYFVENKDYSVNIYTQLIPLENGVYSSSNTYIAVMMDQEVISDEYVTINIPMKLSELFEVLGKVAGKMSNTYKKYLKQSNDAQFEIFSIGYKNMRKECFKLSEIIQHKYSQYDFTIMQSSAILSDPPWWICAGASFVCGFMVGYIVTCAVAAVLTAGVAFAVCFGGALAAAGIGWTILSTCTIFCCCLGFTVCCG